MFWEKNVLLESAKELDMRRENTKVTGMVVSGVVALCLMILTAGCGTFGGPDKTGEFRLSSEKFGTTSYHVMGYSYEEGEFYRFPYKGEPVPDIINEGILVLEGGEVTSLPWFHTPADVNGFALAGEFASLKDARTFYNQYDEVADDLQFEIESDTVELYQVWIQQTQAGNFVKLLVKDLLHSESEVGAVYNEVVLEYTYQPDGTRKFPD